MFLNRNMSVIAYANGFTLWHYKSNEDSLEQITWAGYFQPIDKLAAIGDIVIINGRDGTAIKAITSIQPMMLDGLKS